MTDLSTENACRGLNGRSERHESAPAAHNVDSCCGSWRNRLKLCIPVEYKTEAVQFLKLSLPMVRLSLDAEVGKLRQP